jgi:hypothetical protein
LALKDIANRLTNGTGNLQFNFPKAVERGRHKNTIAPRPASQPRTVSTRTASGHGLFADSSPGPMTVGRYRTDMARYTVLLEGYIMAGVSKQLICPECGQVMAMAVWRVFGGLKITTPGGFLLSPVSDDLLLRTAEQRLASASAEDYPEAKRRRDAIVRDAGDRFYDIKCPRGHYTLKTAPKITKAIRREPGNQVSLA